MSGTRLSYPIAVDGAIELPPHVALKRIHNELVQRLTFMNPLWKKKSNRGLSTHDTPRTRQAFVRTEAGGLRIARGAWRMLRDLAQQHQIDLVWDARTLRAEDRPTSLTLNADLRPYQSQAIQAAQQQRAGVIVIPTGGGKTVIAMGLAAALQTQTLFIVHTRELLRQTISSVERFLQIEPGVIGGGAWKPAPFTIALIQTLSRRDLVDIHDQFGLVIVDEAHHAPAMSYCDILPSFPARYRIALTATPYRKDGMHELLWLHFGEIIYQVKKSDLEEHGRLLIPQFFPIHTDFFYEYQDDFSAMITSLCQNTARHKLVIDTIQETHRPKGCSLVLTERIDHAMQLHRSLLERDLPAVLLHGKLSNPAREEALQQLREGHAEILVATLPLIGEGWDHPPLDTLYLTVPNGNRTKTTQALGRILRPYPNKETPRVYDFLDIRIGLLRHHWQIRGQAYHMQPEEIQAALGHLPVPSVSVEEPRTPPRGDLLQAIQAISRGEFTEAERMIEEAPPIALPKKTSRS
jgi:superfamily II DNA or RNA helicase